MRSILAILAASTLAVLLGGCQYFLGSAFGGPILDPEPSPSQIASYASGHATITLKGGESIELDRLEDHATVDSFFGSDLAWSGASGWHVRVSGAGAGGPGGFGGSSSLGGYLTFDRITDGTHWTTFDGNDRCIVDVTAISAEAFRGSASCKGVVWFDALDMSMNPNGPSPLAEPPFDAEVTFEASR